MDFGRWSLLGDAEARGFALSLSAYFHDYEWILGASHSPQTPTSYGLQHYLFEMLKSKSMPGKPRPLSLPVLLWWRMLLSSFTLSHRSSFLYLKNSNLHWHKKKLRKIISIAVFAVGGLSSHSSVFVPPHSLALSSHLRVSCHGDKKLLTAPAPFPFPGSIFLLCSFLNGSSRNNLFFL